MKSNIYDVNVFDYYKCGHSVVFKIKITDINRKESWYISKSYKEFVQVDDFFRLRYPSIPEVFTLILIIIPIIRLNCFFFSFSFHMKDGGGNIMTNFININ